MSSTRNCSTCNREYIPSSRHLDCPMCIYKRSKIPCPGCKRPMQRTSSSCSDCVNRSGERSPSWKGGKTRHKAGYIMVKVPSHPRAKSNNGYVFEHILVMEEKIGRHLIHGENVHHKNGVKDDNRPSNLELWSRVQPSGQRVVDKIAWAREILATYEPIEGAL